MRRRPLLFALVVALLAWPIVARAHDYLNSASEATLCATSNPNILLCDDFEDSRQDIFGGNWYGEFIDFLPGALPFGANGTRGWSGKSNVGATTTHRCGSNFGAVGTSCSATSGVYTGSQDSINLGDHTLLGETTVNTIYVRWYTRFLPGFVFGHQKYLTINGAGVNTAGIHFGHLKLRGGGVATSVAFEYEISNELFDGHKGQNQGNTLAVTGSADWYFMELRITLETTASGFNGILELWIDNCGVGGNSCPATPTLRMRHTDVHFRLAQQVAFPAGIGNVYLDFWGGGTNPRSTGEFLFDQLAVSRTGPIGFMGAGGPPPTPPLAPTNLLICQGIGCTPS